MCICMYIISLMKSSILQAGMVMSDVQQMPTSSDATVTHIYHEKQKKQLCLLHTLNNLFQQEEFVREDLDQICERLDYHKWFNAHRSWLGLGNYDANILLCALQSRDLVGRWFDKRLSASRIRRNVIIGYIFNIPSTGFVPMLMGRHWFTIKQFGPYYYNLDSKLASPTLINNNDIVHYINTLLAQGNELLLIVSPENEAKCLLATEEEDNNNDDDKNDGNGGQNV